MKKNRTDKRSRSTKRRLALAQEDCLSFHRLEDRNMLASVTVSNATDLTNADTSSINALTANDGGDGISLREAITASNNTTGDDTITFDSSVFTGGANSLIRLTQGELEITETLTIDASMATDVTITGDANGDDVTLPGTFITDVDASIGSDVFDRNGLLNDNSRIINFSVTTGDLTLSDVTITGGRTTGSNGTTDSGGGISLLSQGFFETNLRLTNSAVSGKLDRGR